MITLYRTADQHPTRLELMRCSLNGKPCGLHLTLPRRRALTVATRNHRHAA